MTSSATDAKSGNVPASNTSVLGSQNTEGNKGTAVTTSNSETSMKKTESKSESRSENGSSGNVPTQSSMNNDNERTDQNSMFSLRIKPEYVLKERSSSLRVLPEAPVEDHPAERKEDSSARKSGKKRKGMNKKRPRDAKQDNSEKICLSVIRDTECPYGEKCKFSHDTKAYMATRQPDIKEVEGGCPIFKLRGYCMYGAMCRLGSSHINMTTGKNFSKDDAQGSTTSSQSKPLSDDIVMNALPRAVQVQLRKKTYPFKCKRHFEQNKGNESDPEGRKSDMNAEATQKNEIKTETTQNDTSSSGTPLDLKTRKIIDFSNKVYVAPLTTVGNLPFRRLMKKFGADITCGEMALVTNLLEGKPSEWALLKRHPEEDIFGVQIAAAHPDQYTRGCELIESYTKVDFIDLNLGCPLDLVCTKGAGAALMMRDRKLRGALEGISQTVSCPITVKMRTGWDMAKPFAHNLVPKIQSWGIDGIATIMIHGRSRLQRYQKEANWDYISKVATSQSDDMAKIPVIGNGDIFSFTDFEEKKAREGVSSCAMLARGALIKPWLPTEIKERRHWDISASERLDILKDFVRFGLEHWGSDQQGVNNTRRFLLEWLSFLHRYVPVGLLDVVPQHMNERPPTHMCGRSDLETLFLSPNSMDWIQISEMLLGPVPDGFRFEPKHKANAYAKE